MRYPITALALTTLFALAGCLGGGGGGSSPAGSTAPAFPTVIVNGIGVTTVVTHAGTYDVLVNGVTDTVTIGTGQTLRNLTISGAGVDVSIGATSTVAGAVTLSGTNAILHLPPASPIVVSVTGVGAAVFYDSSAG